MTWPLRPLAQAEEASANHVATSSREKGTDMIPFR
jgi:hypothetical protein